MTSAVRLRDKIFFCFKRRLSDLRSVKRRSLRILILCILLVLSVIYAINDYYHRKAKPFDFLRAAAPLSILIEEGERICPAIFIYHTGTFRGMILCVWKNGRIVWSADQLRGGPPFLEGKIPAATVTQILDEIEDAGFFDDPYLHVLNLAVVSVLTKVALIHRNKVLSMEVPHPIEIAQTQHYAESYFRIRELLDSLIPAEGEVIDFDYHVVQMFRWSE